MPIIVLRHRVLLWILAVFLAALLPTFALAQGSDDYPLADAPSATGGDAEPLQTVGNYCGAFGGVSLHDSPEASFTVEIVGEPISAYLFWAGRGPLGPTGDDTIEVSVNGGPFAETAATVALRADSPVNFSWFTYSHDVITEGVLALQPGTNTIAARGLEINERHGVGLIVLSADEENCPYQEIELWYGNDVLWHGWPPPSGPNTEVVCTDYPSPVDTVEMDIQLFVGGVESEFRSNAIWFATGTGPQPANLVGESFATQLVMPLRGLNGDEFDNYDTVVQDPQPILIERGETWACFQIESPQQPFPGQQQGISATWINLSTRLPVNINIGISPDGVNPVGVAHTFTVTVNTGFLFDSVVITPTITPEPETISDTCSEPQLGDGIATCTVTINSSVPGIYTATATALVAGGNTSAAVTTNGWQGNSDGAVKVYVAEEEPAIDIEKFTNGEDADEPTGPFIAAGDPVTWTYIVENTGSVTLTAVTVTDDQGVSVICPQDVLAVGESMTCTATGTAEAGQYANVGTVTGRSPEDEEVSDDDPSHYFGAAPAIDIEKFTNGEDADDPPGVQVDAGDPVTWTYIVENTGNVTLSDVTVTDDQGVSVTCPQDVLAVGESMTCVATGTAGEGQYANVGTVTGRSPTNEEVRDEDPSHYFGLEPTDLDDSEEPGNLNRRIFLPMVTGAAGF